MEREIMTGLKSKIKATVAAALLAGAGATQAVVIDSSTAYNFAWDYGPTHLDGTGSMTVSGFNSFLLRMDITLSNGASLASERLTAFGFGINPNVAAAFFSDSNDNGLIGATLNANFPAVQGVEVCVRGGPTCAGGGNGGIAGGSSDSFTLFLVGNWGRSINVDPIAFKYQTGYGSFEFTTSSSTSTSTSSGNAPEPGSASLALLGLGLLGAGFGLRRKRATQA
jgi:MYXO-CTERM domain-containing protein